MRTHLCVSSSSKIPILRTLFARQDMSILPSSNAYSRNYDSHLISCFYIRVKAKCRAKSVLSCSKDTETSRYTGKKQRIMRSAYKIRISYVEFYCTYYATRNAIKEHALINKYPWKVSVICIHDTFSCGSRHSFVRSPFTPFKGALRN